MATLQDRRGQLYGTRDLGFTPKKERSFFGALTSGLGHLSNLLYSVSDRGRAASAAERARQARLEEQRAYDREQRQLDNTAFQDFLSARGNIGSQKQRLQTSPSALDMFGSQPRELLPDPRTGVSEMGGVPRIQADYLGSPNEFISPEMLQGIQRDAMLPDIPRTAVPGTGQFEEDMGASATGVEPEIPETPQIPRLPGVGIADRARAADEFNIRQMALDDLDPITMTAQEAYGGLDTSRLPDSLKAVMVQDVAPQTEIDRINQALKETQLETNRFKLKQLQNPQDKIQIIGGDVFSIDQNGNATMTTDLSLQRLVEQFRDKEANARYLRGLGISRGVAMYMEQAGLTYTEALAADATDEARANPDDVLAQVKQEETDQIRKGKEVDYAEAVGGWMFGDRFQDVIMNGIAGFFGGTLATETNEAKERLKSFNLNTMLDLAGDINGRPSRFIQEQIKNILPNLDSAQSDYSAMQAYQALMTEIVNPTVAHWEKEYKDGVGMGGTDGAKMMRAGKEGYRKAVSAQIQLQTIIDVFEKAEALNEVLYKQRPNQGAGAALQSGEYTNFYRTYGN